MFIGLKSEDGSQEVNRAPSLTLTTDPVFNAAIGFSCLVSVVGLQNSGAWAEEI
jgi:hypothetical protein